MSSYLSKCPPTQSSTQAEQSIPTTHVPLPPPPTQSFSDPYSLIFREIGIHIPCSVQISRSILINASHFDDAKRYNKMHFSHI